jgi:hypothetical protein
MVEPEVGQKRYIAPHFKLIRGQTGSNNSQNRPKMGAECGFQAILGTITETNEDYNRIQAKQ